ncbi:MAG: hypothetical protein Q9203_007687, partial [Teloschistes exilis]
KRTIYIGHEESEFDDQLGMTNDDAVAGGKEGEESRDGGRRKMRRRNDGAPGPSNTAEVARQRDADRGRRAMVPETEGGG